MAQSKRNTPVHRSHDSILFRNLSDSVPGRSLDFKGVNSDKYFSSVSSLPSVPHVSTALMGNNPAASFVMTYSLSSPISSPVPLKFGLKSISTPVLYSISEPVSLSSATLPVSSSQYYGNTSFQGIKHSISSPVPFIPKPVKMCRQVSVPLSLPLTRATTLHSLSPGLRMNCPSPFRKLSHNRLGAM